jgi:pimeloyl-ACP methyl ester carboxylesterase
LDCPVDLLSLADHLEIDRFAIVAYSLGGPYGLACAYAFPERLTKVGIVSGAALFTEPVLMQNLNAGTRRYLNLPREQPMGARLFLWMMRTMARFSPSMLLANAASVLPPPDQAVVSDPEVRKKFIALVREAFRQGTNGGMQESLLAVTDWGFRLQEIQKPILLWHSELDQNIPVAMARYVADALPHCEATFYPEEGHLSLFKKNIDTILRALLA